MFYAFLLDGIASSRPVADETNCRFIGRSNGNDKGLVLTVPGRGIQENCELSFIRAALV